MGEPEETSPEDTSPEDTGPEDTGPEDTGPEDTGLVRATADEGEAAPRGGRRRQQSRRKLLDAARRLFVEHGYHDTRPQDIARAADVGHGTFYLHFPDKRACFFAFVDEASAELDALVHARLARTENLHERFEAVISAVVDYHIEHPSVLSAAASSPGVIAGGTDHRVAVFGRWARQWAEKLSTSAEAGVVYDDYNFEVVGWALVGMLNPICTTKLVTPENRQSIIDNLVRLLVRGLIKTS